MTWPQAEEGQDVAEYAIILAVVVLLVVVIVRLIGTSSTNIFSAVGSSIQQ
jgi:Flp pilus assembly pilin Flp